MFQHQVKPLLTLVVLVTFCLLANAAVISFGPPTQFTTSTGPAAVAVGDINRDGRLDWATANMFSSNVTIRFGNGAGTFPSSITLSGYLAPEAIVLADLDRDGDLDLIVANTGSGVFGGSNTIAVRTNNGSGAFNPIATYVVGSTVAPQPRSIAVGDFNRDGRLDLVVANTAENNVSLLRNKGGATFAPPVNFSVGSGPYSVVAGDFNHDSKMDFATANSGDDTVSVRLGNGAGGFGAVNNFFAQTPPPPIQGGQIQPHSIAAGDFDNDGDIDFATANFSGHNANLAISRSLSVLRNNGSATFAPPVYFHANTTANSVKAADFNRDGKLDLAFANINGCPNIGGNIVSVLTGNGNGTFQSPINVSLNYNCLNSAFNPTDLAAGDFNCDGKPDLVVANLNKDFAIVLLNTTAVKVLRPRCGYRVDPGKPPSSPKLRKMNH